MENNDTVFLRIPRDSAPAVRDLMRAHLTELPAAIRNDVSTQLSNWPGGSGAGAQGQGQGQGQAQGGAQDDGGGQAGGGTQATSRR